MITLQVIRSFCQRQRIEHGGCRRCPAKEDCFYLFAGGITTLALPYNWLDEDMEALEEVIND